MYDCNDANHAVNIKNLLEYSPSYAEKTASNEFFYLDTTRNAEEREFTADNVNHLATRRVTYNKGFTFRKALLGTSSTVMHLSMLSPRWGDPRHMFKILKYH